MKQYDTDDVDDIIDGLQDRVVDNMVDVMARQLEAVSAAFSPSGDMDADGITTAFTMLDKLTAEIMVRAMGLNNKDGRYERWLAMHVLGVKRQLAAIAEDREVEHASIEKHLRDVLGAREQ